MAVILGVFALFGNRFSLVNDKKVDIVWTGSFTPAPFKDIGNERFAELGINPFSDPVGSLKAIMRRPLAFLLTAATILPFRVIGYLQSCQFGLFDPTYLVNPAKLGNEFASNLEFYFSLFFIIGMLSCLFKRKMLNSPVFLVLTYHFLFYGVLSCLFAHRLKEVSSPLLYLIGSYGLALILKYSGILKTEDISSN
jgi:hypothetical protein